MPQASETLKNDMSKWSGMADANPDAFKAFQNMRNSVCKEGGALDAFDQMVAEK